jgi:hypothetical protein
LARVDEAYFSAEEEGESETDQRGEAEDVRRAEDGSRAQESVDVVNGISASYVTSVLEYWAKTTGIELDKLARTTYRRVESDVGKNKVSDTERVVELAGRIGGGW